MQSAWQVASAPNYEVNENKHYAYTELPYLGQYQLQQLPIDGKLIDHVDYWGEGRVDDSEGVSGFKDSFNVNHQFQLVSRGADKRKRIPNRIPTEDFSICNTSRYIKDNSVRTITVPAEKLTFACINDIYRMINCEAGFLVVYFNDEDEIKNLQHLQKMLHDKVIYEIPGYILTRKFAEITNNCCCKVFQSYSNSYGKLLEEVNKEDYSACASLLRKLHETKQSALVRTFVDRLLIGANRHTTNLAYLIYTTNTELFENYFAQIYKLLFSSSEVKLVSSHYNLGIKLDVNLDSYNDRLAWGAGYDDGSDRLNWKFVPVYENNLVYFKLKNVKYDMYMKLDVTPDSFGDREAWGSALSEEDRFLWKVEPVKVQGKIVFLIINKHYNQGLKMAENTDSYNDRVVRGSDCTVRNEPLKYGWVVPAWIS